MFGLVSRKKIIKTFAKVLAERQKKADYWFYVCKEQKMSSFILESVDGIVRVANALCITKEVYYEAYKIYDFKNSGKEFFVPDLDKLKI